MAQSFNTSELVDLIVSAGLVEDFVEWYRKRFNTAEVPSLKSLPPYILEEYIKRRNLASSNDPLEESLKTRDEILKYEPLEVKPRISPKTS
ncbi:MAG: hypothetical protein GSR82_02155 [Desulfurococcales archaeon]|nr:hypothetical protein [Desulfurococcales archaeon]MEB3772467.1 hypothetical protein [Desulfurococcales archaeon]MEB3786863.1 hypothetical protein [Desulfurococcales archaeon]MEB3799496.1 hypothetical protein [Desulfurococcales archaeon]MEB3845881.1 hypothetical protein [Desulfurococcales archaeon]